MVCLCDLQESGRAFRWSKDVVHWALTLQFHGGKRIIDDLRGQANAGAGQHGKLKVDVSKWGLFLPANSTLRNYLPPVEVYEGFDQASINQFKTAFPSESPRKVIIAWDEIEIRYGLVWNPSTKELIGKVNGPIAEKSAKEENWLNMSTQLATHVIQFFLVSADGAASVPIGFYPMVSINGNKVFAIIKPLIDMLQAGSDALQVVATASDAFPSNDALIKLLKDSGYNIVHLFDPLHLLKNMRNNIFNRVLTCNASFGLNTLDDLLGDLTDKASRQRFTALHPNSPFPRDQMDLAPIRALLKEELVLALQAHSKQCVKELGDYLHHLRLFDLATTNNEMDNSVRFHNLDSVVAYFKTLKGLTSGLVHQLSTTVESLKAVHQISVDNQFEFRVSVLGTIVVENYFSTVRSKCRYPNLWEYAVYSRRALLELTKSNAGDYLFIGPKKGEDQWKKYGNQRGIDFSVDSIKLWSKKEKQDLADSRKATNGGSLEDLAFCQAKGREYLCKRKRMTIREIKSKDSPFTNKAKITVRVRCPVDGCHRNYVYEGHLANHLFSKHSEKFSSIEGAQSLAHTAHEAAFARALQIRAEDHGLALPFVAETTSMDFEMDEYGLPLEDPDRLEEGEILEEEEVMTGFAGQPIFSSSSSSSLSSLLAPDWSDFSMEELTSEDLLSWDMDALLEMDPMIVVHVQQPQLPPQLHQPLQQPHQPMSLAEWIAAGVPPPPANPLPLDLELGQHLRPVLIDFECNDFRALEPIEMTVKCLITGKVFTTLIKCEHRIHFRAWQIHGISKRMLEHEPDFRAAFALLGEWLTLIGSDPQELILFLAHNAPFDLRVMRKAVTNIGIPFPGNWMFHDTIKIIKEYRPNLPSYALGKLADSLGCLNKPTHRSASDVRCLAEILHKIFGPQLENVAKGVARCVFEM